MRPRYRMALEGGEITVRGVRNYPENYTKGEKLFLCKKCNKVWQYEAPNIYGSKEIVKFDDWFPKLQKEKTCPECLTK